MKKIIYIASFTFLGILFQFLIHAWVEIWYINLLITDFPRYSFRFSWQQWYTIHHIASVILLLAGIVFGFWQGKYWWRQIYELGRFDKFRWLKSLK